MTAPANRNIEEIGAFWQAPKSLRSILAVCMCVCVCVCVQRYTASAGDFFAEAFLFAEAEKAVRTTGGYLDRSRRASGRFNQSIYETAQRVAGGGACDSGNTRFDCRDLVSSRYAESSVSGITIA